MSGDDAEERSDVLDPSNPRVALLFAAVLLLTPSLLLVIAFAFLAYAEALVVGELTPLELVELYVLEFLILAAVGLVVFWILKRMVGRY